MARLKMQDEFEKEKDLKEIQAKILEVGRVK